MPVSVEAVKARLALVPGPDGRTPLSQYAGLSDIVVSGDKVYFSIEVPAERAEALEPMRKAAETAVRAMPEVKGGVVALTAQAAAGAARTPPVATRPAPHGHAQVHTPVQTEKAGGIGGVRHVIAVASGKGGVGKSTTSANLALGLAAHGLKVGLLDADIFGPSVPRLFGLSGRPQLGADRAIEPFQKYGLKLMSIGFLVDEDTAMIWRGPMVMSAINQLLKEVRWGDLDVLVIDMPPGTGDAQLTLAQNASLAGAVIVSTPQDLALIDARRGIAMFGKVNVPILGVVENMSYFVCPDCGGRHDIFAHGGARDEAAKLGAPFLGEIPLAMAIRANSDAGTPITVADPAGVHATVYRDIAAKVIKRLGSGALAKAAPAIVFE